MIKVVREILRLFWKLLRQTFWQWLKPILARMVFLAILVIAVLTLAFVLIAR
jgi:hypothetical protein